MRTFTAVLMAMCLAVLAAAAPARAATPADEGSGVTEGQYRFDFKVIDGKLYRVDRKTGAAELVNVGEGPERTELKGSKVAEIRADRPKPDDKKKNSPPKIKVSDEDKDTMTVINSETPTVLTDVHRRHAEPDISDYKSHLSFSQVVVVRNGTVEGSITLRNTGDQKIRDLELTLVVPTSDGNAERYRYRMGTDPDLPFGFRPPLPNGPALMVPVKEKAPAGAGAALNERIRTEITYLRFADE